MIADENKSKQQKQRRKERSIFIFSYLDHVSNLTLVIRGFVRGIKFFLMQCGIFSLVELFSTVFLIWLKFIVLAELRTFLYKYPLRNHLPN